MKVVILSFRFVGVSDKEMGAIDDPYGADVMACRPLNVLGLPRGTRFFLFERGHLCSAMDRRGRMGAYSG
jgi:hypothetical protein